MRTAHLETKTYLTIGEAAERLYVSIDTIRRWERAGKIAAVRSAGGIRLFPIDEIERLFPQAQKYQKHLTVSQAAHYLGISPSTLRRWDRQGLLQPERTMANERVYDEAKLLAFVKTTPQKLVADPIDNPVQFVKEKATEISDSIYLTVFSRHYAQQIMPKALFSIIVLIILIIAIGTNQSSSHTLAVQQTLSPNLSTAQRINGVPVAQAIVNYTGITAQATLPADSLAPEIDQPIVLQDQNNHAVEMTFVSPNQIIPLATPSVSPAIIPTTLTIQTHDLSQDQKSALFDAGSGTVADGHMAVFIAEPNMTTSSKVFISMTNNQTNAAFQVAKQPQQGFEVTMAHPASSQITFDWLIIK